MKKIVYPDRHNFVLTNKEFGEAYVAWQAHNEYLCERLDAILTNRYIYTAPLYDTSDYEHRVLITKNGTNNFAYNKEKKEIWYADGNWEYEKLLNSITGRETYSGLIPKMFSIGDHQQGVEEKIKVILDKTMSIDDYIDMKYKK